jgi:hypothetical protein
MGILTMEHLGVINAEGGPLLLADFNVAQAWRGIDADSADYQRACEAFDSQPDLEGTEIVIPNGRGILWEMRGAGTADVFLMNENQLTVMRAWLENPLDNTTLEMLAACPSENLTEIGHLLVPSGALAMFWAVEDGKCFRSPDADGRRPSGEVSVENSALIVQVGQTSFRCQHDKVKLEHGTARRLHLSANKI